MIILDGWWAAGWLKFFFQNGDVQVCQFVEMSDQEGEVLNIWEGDQSELKEYSICQIVLFSESSFDK